MRPFYNKDLGIFIGLQYDTYIDNDIFSKIEEFSISKQRKNRLLGQKKMLN